MQNTYISNVNITDTDITIYGYVTISNSYFDSCNVVIQESNDPTSIELEMNESLNNAYNEYLMIRKLTIGR